METDKKSYNIGEKAKIVYEGEKGAKALITIEKSGQIVKDTGKMLIILK